jgi:osmoprotectant transport system permease protein
VLIALPIGLLIGHSGRGGYLITVVNSLRALPTYGLLIFFVVWISPHVQGRGDRAYLIPSIIVLTVLAIPGIMANTYAGVQNVDAQALDAARGMGMRGGQVLRRVEFPCALPLIISGLRNATLQVIATATITAQISLGGLGRYLIDGLSRHEYYTLMAPGAVLVAALALIIDLLWALVGRVAVSRGLSGRYRRGSNRPIAGVLFPSASPRQASPTQSRRGEVAAGAIS